MFVKNPGRDFVRNRKLDFSPSKSAFIQQRSKIQLYAFEHLIKKFNKKLSFAKTYKNNRLLAVDGAYLNYAANPNNKER